MRVEGSYGVVEGFLKYVSNYNREFYKNGLGCVVWLCCLEQEQDGGGWDALNDKLESAADTCGELMNIFFWMSLETSEITFF